ncbi:MAG: ABC transporter permease [Candidatus Omnitrophica bacterium]|nr:ABC transporter permease [Candidatus Omnitrophota bacterium]
MDYIVYEPNKNVKLGLKIWPAMFRELVGSRELIWRLFVRNWSAKYKQAVLGYLWAIIMPFIAIGTFVFLNRVGVLNIGETGAPYPLFALIGLTVWQLFATGLNSGCQSLVASGGMISKINFPIEVLVIASLAQAIFEFLVKFILIVIFFIVFKFIPAWTIVLFPLAIIPIVLLTLGLSLFFSLVNGVLRDTANAVSVITTFLMFLTPVLYPLKDKANLFFKFNPLAPLVVAPRDLIIYGHIKEPVSFLMASTLSILIFFICWRIFYLAKTKIPERL